MIPAQALTLTLLTATVLATGRAWPLLTGRRVVMAPRTVSSRITVPARLVAGNWGRSWHT